MCPPLGFNGHLTAEKMRHCLLAQLTSSASRRNSGGNWLSATGEGHVGSQVVNYMRRDGERALDPTRHRGWKHDHSPSRGIVPRPSAVVREPSDQH